MLLGLAIGDALGNTTEGMLPAERRHHYGEIRDYVKHPCRPGLVGVPSDDTQLAFWTLDQMNLDGGLIPANLAQRLASEHIYGIGHAVADFVDAVRAGRSWLVCAQPSAGNGALMRIAPVAIPALSQGSTSLYADVTLAAALTHNDAASTAACVGFAALLVDLLARDEVPEAAAWLESWVSAAAPVEGDETANRPKGGRWRDEYSGPLWRYTAERVKAALGNGDTVLDACNSWYSGAYLLETMPSVLYILARHGDDPEEAIVRAVNDTKDNDSIAAIVGAAVGALHGKEALPERWRRGLTGRLGADDDGHVQAILDDARARWWTGA